MVKLDVDVIPHWMPSDSPSFPHHRQPNPSTHLFPLPSSALQLPELPAHPPHLHLIGSSATHYIHQSTPLFSAGFLCCRVCRLCLYVVVLKTCYLSDLDLLLCLCWAVFFCPYGLSFFSLYPTEPTQLLSNWHRNKNIWVLSLIIVSSYENLTRACACEMTTFLYLDTNYPLSQSLGCSSAVFIV